MINISCEGNPSQDFSTNPDTDPKKKFPSMENYPLAILTDSTCDIPESLLKENAILVLPLILIWNGKVYRDRVDLSPQEFYQRLGWEAKGPTTTMPAPADFMNIFHTAVQQGAREIVMFTVSSGMSGTYQTALAAAAQMDVPVHVVDSKGPTMSLGWQTLAAARARAQGADLQAILQVAADVRTRLAQVVCMNTIEYLYRGGRIGGATHLVGSLLNLKPIVQINHKTGLVESAGRERTHTKAVSSMFHRFFELVKPSGRLHIAVLHGNVPDEAEQIADRIQHEYSPQELLVNITGPVLGLYTGPGALALCGYSEED
jgi:DegV family protein with EDD domain